MSALPPLYKTWPERELDNERRELGQSIIPAWDEVMASDADTIADIQSGVLEWPPHSSSYLGVFGDYRLPGLSDFSSLTLGCFAGNRDMRAFISAVYKRSRMLGMHEEDIAQHASQILHQTFHLMHWQHFGRKTYYLDDTTYQLLMHTPLPKLPASVLSAPTHSFYLMLPPSAFKFAVAEDAENPQRVEGILVTIDRIEPDADRREVAVFMTGESKQHGNSNVAYYAVGLGGNALLSDIKLGTREGQYASLDPEGHLSRTVPRLVFGLLLYLASEHPDIEPVPPMKRDKFANIRSPKQREAALRNQEAKLAKYSRLGYMYVGRHVGEAARANATPEETTTGHWKLDKQVWVSGHHKMQFYGPNRAFRRPIWIQPYRKGPDMAEQMEAKLRKIQRAQESEG